MGTSKKVVVIKVRFASLAPDAPLWCVGKLFFTRLTNASNEQQKTNIQEEL
jgi:hypothetical protein